MIEAACHSSTSECIIGVYLNKHVIHKSTFYAHV